MDINVYEISRYNVHCLLKHWKVCIVNCQKITPDFLQLNAALNVDKPLQSDVININTKLDNFYVWKFLIKDYF